MRACNQHMRSICGDVLEKRSGSNYRIVTGDCICGLRKLIADGTRVDYVFGDLTDMPIAGGDAASGDGAAAAAAADGPAWDFIMSILQLSLRVLRPGGKYMTHGNGVSCPDSLRAFESRIERLEPAVAFKRATAFVPSFLEDWVFYQLSFADQQQLEDGSS